jgi:uncharacterized protein
MLHLKNESDMNQIQKNDNYNFAQPSRTGRAGFELFKNDKDGLYYFHFNDAKGIAFLFSQGYQRETSRDKGVQSVIKNAADETHFERQEVKTKGKNTEGGYFFVLRSGNRQEIARSVVFKSHVELVEKQTYLRQNLSLSAHDMKSKENTAMVEQAAAQRSIAELSPIISPTVKAAENENLKEKVDKDRGTLTQSMNPNSDSKNLSDDTLRHIFRIEIYKSNTTERLFGKIIHPFSDQTKTFTGFDSTAILSFMTEKLQADLPKTTTSLKGNQPPSATSVKPKPSLELSPVKIINLSKDTLVPHSNQPFGLVLTALPNECRGIQVEQPCDIEIYAYNLDIGERYKLLEKHGTVLSDTTKNDLFVRIEPLVLFAGSYRISVVVHIMSNDNTEKTEIQKWQGSIILQIY